MLTALLLLAHTVALGRGPSESPLSLPTPPPLRALQEKSSEELHQVQERRNTPEAKRERHASKTAHRNLSGDEALGLAKREFAGALAAPLWPTGPRGGERVKAYIDDTTLLLDEGTGPDRLVESTVPLRAPDDQGHKAPINLTLEDNAGGFRPRNALSDIRLPKDPRGAVRLGQTGITLAPLAGARDAKPQIVHGDRLFYPNVEADTDLILAPTATGVETFVQLRSRESPEEVEMRFELPEGARLRLAEGKRGEVSGAEIVRGEQRLGIVSAPLAFDAQGAPVRVGYELRGQRLVINVAHRDQDYAMPILVDPLVTERYDFTGVSAGTTYDRWQFSTSHSGWISGGISSNKAYVQGWDASGSSNWGQWVWPAYPDTRIGRADFYNVSASHSSDGMYGGGTCVSTYLWSPSSTRGTNRRCDPFGPDALWRSCDSAACDGSQHTDNNQAVFHGDIYGPDAYYNDVYGSATFTGAEIASNDFHPPTVSGIQNQYIPPGGTTYQNGLPGWTKNFSGRANISTSDVGFGLWDLRVRTVDTGRDIGSHPGAQRCGNRFRRCANSGTWNADYDTTTLSEGITKLRGYSLDAVDNRGENATFDWNAKIDRTGPNVVASGRLKDAQGQRVDEESTGLGLHVDATDGDATNPRSGVSKIEIQVDGRPQGSSPAQTCTGDSCSLARDWTFRPGAFAVGDHTITVIAPDQVGNTTQQSWKLTVTHAATAGVGPGQVNLSSGGFTVSSTDVAVTSFGSGLSLSRTYNSRDVAAGSDGAFGPGWVSSLPSDSPAADYSQLLELPDASGVEVTTPDGNALSFSKSATGFAPPPGFEELKLSATTGGYQLTDSDGNVTVFTKPATSAAAFKPTETREPGSANKTSYAYELVPGTTTGATRVTRVIAPAPAGVTCDPATPLGSEQSMAPGCRVLRFRYATSTMATGTAPDQVGDYAGRLSQVDFTAWDPASTAMTTDTVAQYTYDSTGRLRAAWDPRISPALKESYAYDADGHLTSLTPPGQEAWTMSYAPLDASAPAGDPDRGRLRSLSRPALPGTATTTMAYRVPRSGTGAPNQMAASDVAAWDQKDVPAEATAIFPPDAVPADPPANYDRALVHYLDDKGREVNVATPGGHVTTTEFENAHDNVVRTLSAANRERALATGLTVQDHAARARQLDTQQQYSADGIDLIESIGPLHAIELTSGEMVDARKHTKTTYNEGAPAGDYHLPTTVTVGAQISGRSDADVRMTKTAYGGQSGLGWTLRQPTSATTDAGGLNLTRRSLYDPDTGLETERRMPANPNGGDAHATQTVYYGAAANATDPECGGKPEWAALACKKKPAAQPGTPALPDLPVTTLAYNRLDQLTTSTETVGVGRRTTTTTYDAAGRDTGQQVTATEGRPVPATTKTYDPQNGRLATTSSTENGATSTITRSYDTLGRPINYVDADGNVSTTTYDLLGRPVTTNDGKASQTRSYDPTSGLLTQLSDSAAGTFTASYDGDGKMTRQGLPNGLEQRTTYDETGQATHLAYEKVTNCSSSCTWLDFGGRKSIDDQWLTDSGSSGERHYAYDGAGRLVQVKDRPTGKGCKVRDYAYDADSNRLRSTTHDPAADGSCDAGSTGNSVSHSYDAADRLTDPGTDYDSFGRTRNLPSQDSGGGQLVSAYFANDLTQSLGQDGVTQTAALDPAGRQRTLQQTGGDGQTHRFHYSDDSDNPSWTAESTDGLRWTRNVEGIGGDLGAIQDSQSGTTLQLTNLHGDIVATASLDSSAMGVLRTLPPSDEFGVPSQPAGDRYGWLGGKQRPTELPSGVMQMGVRTYVPTIGRFEQTDPVEGGSANAYDYTNQDPVNLSDFDGRKCPPPRNPLARALYERFGNRWITTSRADGMDVRWWGGPHLFARMVQRRVSWHEVGDVMKYGRRFYDSLNDNWAFIWRSRATSRTLRVGYEPDGAEGGLVKSIIKEKYRWKPPRNRFVRLTKEWAGRRPPP